MLQVWNKKKENNKCYRNFKKKKSYTKKNYKRKKDRQVCHVNGIGGTRTK